MTPCSDGFKSMIFCFESECTDIAKQHCLVRCIIIIINMIRQNVQLEWMIVGYQRDVCTMSFKKGGLIDHVTDYEIFRCIMD